MSPARALDQFYTSPVVAKACFEFLKKSVSLFDTDLFLEPSAGDGAFFKLMPPGRRVGVDVEPKHPDVERQNYLTEFVPRPGAWRWVVVGNPPFGKNSSLAVRFFQKSAEFADVIAFVVPLTFRKQSLQRRLPANFVLVDELPLSDNAFVFEGKPYSVPCCFQVWRKSAVPRNHVLAPLSHVDFEFCEPAHADFAIRRVGGLAGKVIRDFDGYSVASHYFIRSRLDAGALAARFESIDWTDTKWNTAGNPSIGKRELVAKYSALRATQRRAKSLTRYDSAFA